MRLNPSLPRRWCAQMEVGEDVRGSLWQRPCLAYSGYLMAVSSVSPKTASAQLCAFPVRKARDGELGRVQPAKARWTISTRPAGPTPPPRHPTPAPLYKQSPGALTGPLYQPPLHSALFRLHPEDGWLYHLQAFAHAVPSAWSVLPPSPLPCS